MYWKDEVKQNIKKKREILFSKSSECLQELQYLIDMQSRTDVVLWALSFAKEAAEELNRNYPSESAPLDAIEATTLWAEGKIKMPVAKREILACHALAKRIDSSEDKALCHAIGQACGSVHTKGHALGFPIYELTAIIRKYGIDDCSPYVEKRMSEYIERLKKISDEKLSDNYKWADFLTRQKDQKHKR